MSTFNGAFSEVPHNVLRADNFESPAGAYLLSHFHSDHTSGMDRITDKNCVIYCSEITAQLVRADQRYCHAHTCLRPLSHGEPHCVSALGQEFTLTLIAAGHCLGSVMFLVEYESSRILYTGDFRFKVGAAQHIPALHDTAGVVKRLDAIYLDTTYLSPAAEFIPTREACTVAVVRAAAEWLERDPLNVVRIIGKARFSYEFLYSAIREELGHVIHISQSKLAEYGDFADDLKEDLTLDAATRIHACSYSSKDMRSRRLLPCSRKHPHGALLTIQASSMYFERVVGFGQISSRISNHHLRVCFCFHPSFSELQDLLRYLRPRRARACVPVSGEPLSKTQSRLDSLLGCGASVRSQDFLGDVRPTDRKRRASSGASRVEFDYGSTQSSKKSRASGDGNEDDADDADDDTKTNSDSDTDSSRTTLSSEDDFEKKERENNKEINNRPAAFATRENSAPDSSNYKSNVTQPKQNFSIFALLEEESNSVPFIDLTGD